MYVICLDLTRFENRLKCHCADTTKQGFGFLSSKNIVAPDREPLSGINPDVIVLMSWFMMNESTHSVATAGAYLPSGHITHSVPGLLSASTYPTEQSVHWVHARAANFPDKHGAQGVPGSLSSSAYPAKQSVQDVDPTDEY